MAILRFHIQRFQQSTIAASTIRPRHQHGNKKYVTRIRIDMSQNWVHLAPKESQELPVPLVNCPITMENHHFFMGKSTINGHFQ